MKCGLLGESLKHSFSPQIHARLGSYSYSLFAKRPQEVAAFLQSEAFDGLNVTIPYKETVVPYCSELSQAAEAIGSVNTILRRDDGSLFGDNTDVYGFRYLLRQNRIAVEGKKTLVLGSGGASKMVRTVLRELGAREIIVVSRRGETHYGNMQEHADAELIVNTTPVGMYPRNGETLLDLAMFPSLHGVVDLIYNPARTALLLDAEERGILAVNGLVMLVAQAKRAGELFLNQVLDDALVGQITTDIGKETQNIALIGMPGCGKSSVGRKLAQSLGRRFIDLDRMVEETAGKRIPQLFAEDGEAAFRRYEHAALAKAAKENGVVIATGGGIVTQQENYRLLRQNGVIVLLERPLSELSSEGRPLSQRCSVETLYAQRQPLYEAWSDHRISCYDMDVTVNEIKERLKL